MFAHNEFGPLRLDLELIADFNLERFVAERLELSGCFKENKLCRVPTIRLSECGMSAIVVGSGSGQRNTSIEGFGAIKVVLDSGDQAVYGLLS